MGAVARVLDAKDHLEVMHRVFHPGGEPFAFDWKWLVPSGLSTKDFVAPSYLCFGSVRMFGLGGRYGAVSFRQILFPELSDEMLVDFLNTADVVELRPPCVARTLLGLDIAFQINPQRDAILRSLWPLSTASPAMRRQWLPRCTVPPGSCNG